MNGWMGGWMGEWIKWINRMNGYEYLRKKEIDWNFYEQWVTDCMNEWIYEHDEWIINFIERERERESKWMN